MKKISKTVFIIVVLLLAVRAVLPEVIKYNINKYLADNLEGYKGSIEDFDLSLYRGAFQTEGFKIWQESRTQVPLVQVEALDCAISWRHLFNGKLLANIAVSHPRLNFIDSKEAERKQTGRQINWNKLFDDLIPMEVNRLIINNGVIRVLNYDLKVPAEVVVKDLDIRASDIVSHRTKELLPSEITVTGILQSDARFELKGKFSSLAESPAFDVDFQIKDFDLKKLNNILIAYGPISFTKGEVSIYSEAASKDGRLIAYVKPFLDEVDIVKKDETFFNFKHLGLELVSAGGNLLFRNDDNDTAATKIEIRGPLKRPRLNTDKALSFTIDNASGRPLKEGVEHSIDISRL